MNPNLLPPPLAAGAIDLLQEMLLERGAIRADFSLYQNFMEARRELLLVPEQGKCDADAARFRNTGNRLYLDGKYEEALVWYNRSICFAEKGTDQLATGYGNRSAVYYEQGEYEFALYNIDLAKKHGYPEKLMPKLRIRELNCKQQIAAGRSKGTVPSPRMDINVDTNPKIPFLAKGIKVDDRRILVAEKDFNPGDVIMDAEPLLTAIDFNLCYENCSHCGVKFSNSLIPCPGCVFFMYCGEECRQKSWKLWHRFECPVATKLRNFSNFNVLSTPRLFFYGLSLFDDDLTEMKRFCEANEGAELNRFELDYSNLDRRELFRILYNKEPRRDEVGEFNGYMEEKLISYGYYLVFQLNPLMVPVTAGCRNFTIQTLNKLARLATTLLSNNRDYLGRIISWIFPAIPANIHTCDPNAHTAFESGRMKMVLLRPVAAGQPFVESFGPTWWSSDPEPRPPGMSCSCAACDDGQRGRLWRAQLHRKPPPETAKDFAVAAQVLSSDNIGDAAKLNALQQFIKRNGHVHPAVQVGQILERYRLLLTKAIHAERGALNRAQLQAAYVEQ